MGRKLVKEIDLVFFQDDATGDYGLAHKDTYNNSISGTPFNAFWDGMGLFHDVWEHSHEYNHKYFLGENAMNVSGEMVAMGAMWYYFDELGVSNRMVTRHISPGDNMKRTTMDMVIEALNDGYTNYGSTLNCVIPKQKPIDNTELEFQISDFWATVKNQKYSNDNHYQNEREAAKIYKKSVTFRKIADSHRFGYRMAEKLVPNNYENRNTLYNFFEYWEQFCKDNNAETMHYLYSGITFKIYKEHGIVSWKAIVTPKYGFGCEVNEIIIDSNKSLYRIFDEDYYIFDEDYHN